MAGGRQKDHFCDQEKGLVNGGRGGCWEWGYCLKFLRRPRCFWFFKGRNMCCDIENVTILHCPRGFPSLNILLPIWNKTLSRQIPSSDLNGYVGEIQYSFASVHHKSTQNILFLCCMHGSFVPSLKRTILYPLTFSGTRPAERKYEEEKKVSKLDLYDFLLVSLYEQLHIIMKKAVTEDTHLITGPSSSKYVEIEVTFYWTRSSIDYWRIYQCLCILGLI